MLLVAATYCYSPAHAATASAAPTISLLRVQVFAARRQGARAAGQEREQEPGDDTYMQGRHQPVGAVVGARGVSGAVAARSVCAPASAWAQAGEAVLGGLGQPKAPVLPPLSMGLAL